MRKSTILLLLITINVSVIAQRRNNHNHNLKIQELILTDYLMYLDSTIENVDDTLLIENNISIPQLNRIKVKYVPNSLTYIWNMGDSYLSISKKMYFESDTSICISLNLHENILEYQKKEKLPSSSRSPVIIGETEYYVGLNLKTKQWILLDRKKINAQFAYRNESNWVVMNSTTVRQFINALGNVKQGRYRLNSITTVGQVDRTWVKKEDLEFLISLINSTEKSSCIVRSISSQRDDWDDISTIGAQVTQILSCYIKGKPYPYRLNCCPKENEKLKQDILDWWNNRED